jgi:hypothetical protein
MLIKNAKGMQKKLYHSHHIENLCKPLIQPVSHCAIKVTMLFFRLDVRRETFRRRFRSRSQPLHSLIFHIVFFLCSSKKHQRRSAINSNAIFYFEDFSHTKKINHKFTTFEKLAEWSAWIIERKKYFNLTFHIKISLKAPWIFFENFYLRIRNSENKIQIFRQKQNEKIFSDFHRESQIDGHWNGKPQTAVNDYNAHSIALIMNAMMCKFVWLFI